MSRKNDLLDICWKDYKEETLLDTCWKNTKKTLLDICWKDYKDDLTGHMLEERLRPGHMLEGDRQRRQLTLDICWKVEDLTGHMLEGRRPYRTYVGRTTLKTYVGRTTKKTLRDICPGRTTKKTLLDICWKDDFTGHMSRKDYKDSPYWTYVGRTTLDLTGHMLEGLQRRLYWTYVGTL